MRSSYLVLIGLMACGDSGPPPDAAPTMIEVAVVPSAPTRDLDVLFQVDDSAGTADFQVSLAIAIGDLLTPLATLEGGMPNLHIGVITSDLGTSSSLDYDHPAPTIGTPGIGGCVGHGKDGLLQTGQAAALPGSFVVDEDDGSGGRFRNYPGDITAVLGQMVKVGSGGCGFEQPLASTRRALTNPANGGFLRTSANLLTVIIADEDDCSIRDGALFGPDSTALGPLQSFRCFAQGVECDEDVNVVGTKTNCRPRADSPYVDDVTPFVDVFDGLKPNRAKLVVAGILGSPTPVAVEARTPPGGATTIASLAHSCSWQDQPASTTVADPPVRLASFIDQFGARGTLTSVCQANLSPAVKEIVRATKQMFGVACLDSSKLADHAPEPGIQPSCEASLLTPAGDTPVAIPPCPSDRGCFDLVEDASACPDTVDHLRVAFTPPVPVAADSYVTVRCEERSVP